LDLDQHLGSGFDERVLGHVERLRAETGRFRISASNRPDPFATCYVVQLLAIMKRLASISERERAAIVDYLRGFQRGDGYFVDFAPDGWTPHQRELNDLLLTDLVTGSLLLLDAEPRHGLGFLAPMLSAAGVRRWYDRRRCFALTRGDAWSESIAVMSAIACLRHHATLKGIETRGWEPIEAHLNWLCKLQDRWTGLWGTTLGPRSRARLVWSRIAGRTDLGRYVAGMGAAFHIVDAFAAADRRPGHCGAMVRCTLRCQHADGLFYPAGGGSQCHDLDAVAVLANLSPFVSGDLRRRIRTAFLSVLRAVAPLEAADGGFWSYADGRGYRKGDSDLVVAGGESDLLSTWFRVATIAFIDTALARSDPGWRGRAWVFPPRGYLHLFTAAGLTASGETTAGQTGGDRRSSA